MNILIAKVVITLLIFIMCTFVNMKAREDWLSVITVTGTIGSITNMVYILFTLESYQVCTQ